MPLFMIKRDAQGASEEDMNAGAFRAIACAFNYEGLKWLKSYWSHEAGVSYCIYEAQSADQIRDHALRARIPCDQIMEVDPMSPEQFLGLSTAGEASVS